MSESAALLAAIRHAPDDDAPRLIYADWLDEHGQPERAEFIRVQIELAQNDSATLRKREAELLAEHHDRFAGNLARPGLRYIFRRGFIRHFGHTGVYEYVESAKADSSRIILRFVDFYNGEGAVGWFPTKRPASEWPYQYAGIEIQYASPPLGPSNGNYEIDALADPATINIKLHRFDAEPIVHDGVFQGDSILIWARRRLTRRRYQMRFQHVHLEGLRQLAGRRALCFQLQ